mgnify:CR=1 FL=1
MYILHWLFILHFSSFFFPVASSFYAASLELAIQYIGTRDGANTGSLEQLTDHCMTDHLLLEYRIQHTLHSSFYIFDGLVDDLVQTYIYFLTLCNGFCSCIRTYIETNDDGIGSRSQGNVRLIDSTNAAVDYLYYYFFIRQLGQALLYCFYRTLERLP